MDTNALREFYGRYSKELYLYIYSLCRSKEISEDICQETFLKAMLSLPSHHTNPRAWLYTVGRNLCINHLKREACRADMEEFALHDCEDVIEKIIYIEKKQKLYKAMQRIDSRKREVLVLQYFAGLSQKEISAVMNLTPENVRILGYRGKREIKKIMEADGYDI